MSELDKHKEHRKKELMEKVDNLAKTVLEIKPRNKQEAIAAMSHHIYIANIHACLRHIY